MAKQKVKKNMGKMARRKGHQFERDVANLFKEIFPEAKRHLEYQASEANGIDITGTYPFMVQCKRGRKYASLTAIEQVQIDPIEGGIPVLVTKGDEKEPMAALPLKEFLRLVKKVYRPKS